MTESHRNHGAADAVPKNAALGRDGRVPKRVTSTEHHSSSTASQLAGVGAGGISKPTASGGQVGNVLDKPPLPKRSQGGVPFHPSMKHRDGHTAEDGHANAVAIVERSVPSHPDFRGKGGC